MKSMLGCLFIFIFGGILLFIGLIRIVTQMLFGKGTSSLSLIHISEPTRH